MFKMTKRAAEFHTANRLSPVVYGSVLGQVPDNIKGAYYRLANGSTFKLTVADCRSLPGTPRWAINP